ncbi:hypothetical protein HAX54_031967, partial [Datura stramonium]|nr:hypothetical protein [Datura stramonium]
VRGKKRRREEDGTGGWSVQRKGRERRGRMVRLVRFATEGKKYERISRRFGAGSNGKNGAVPVNIFAVVSGNLVVRWFFGHLVEKEEKRKRGGRWSLVVTGKNGGGGCAAGEI